MDRGPNTPAVYPWRACAHCTHAWPLVSVLQSSKATTPSIKTESSGSSPTILRNQSADFNLKRADPFDARYLMRTDCAVGLAFAGGVLVSRLKAWRFCVSRVLGSNASILAGFHASKYALHPPAPLHAPMPPSPTTPPLRYRCVSVWGGVSNSSIYPG